MKLFADDAWRTTWNYFKESKGGLWGLGFLGLVMICVIFADVIAPFDPSLQNREALLLPPIWTEAGHWPYILGTDAVGRDMLSRLIYGARYSMFIGFVVVSLAVIVGTLLGLIAGYYQSWLDTIIMRLMDVILAFPSLLLALGLVAVLGPGLVNAMYAIALVMLPHFVRLTRANVLSEKNRDYVIASRIVGASNWRLMFNSILPNCMAPLIVQATLSFSNAILDAAALGFLGMGAQPPIPEWGAMLAEAREFISRAWWVVTFPGLAILLTVLSINLVGDALRDALDPRMRRS
ncbi:ABC transporter permease subunit [uncultured Thiothrix sp.]|uniref:ABC transporter permease subunit n=1 Tax=uncultured Thiothrix sp. TaxID=223185 RepID=UPI00262B4B57|nr:ABC transporter permease subunit [uncultured Thiothrix sp.]HMT94954.1 ABC transporter permease subunit [Thiolinea sp.]